MLFLPCYVMRCLSIITGTPMRHLHVFVASLVVWSIILSHSSYVLSGSIEFVMFQNHLPDGMATPSGALRYVLAAFDETPE